MANSTTTVAVVFLSLLPLFLLALRILYVSPIFRRVDTTTSHIVDFNAKGSNIMILLGSGGHTGEMIRILGNVDLNEFTRTWITSSGDSTSLAKGVKYEEENLSNSAYKAHYLSLSRARRVGEPLVLSIISTLKSFIHTLTLLSDLPQLPKVLLLNGPGTSVPLAYILFGLKFLGLCRTKIIYIESLARVSLLSLSGKLLLPIADRFIVQWERLAVEYKRAEYYGILI